MKTKKILKIGVPTLSLLSIATIPILTTSCGTKNLDSSSTNNNDEGIYNQNNFGQDGTNNNNSNDNVVEDYNYPKYSTFKESEEYLFGKTKTLTSNEQNEVKMLQTKINALLNKIDVAKASDEELFNEYSSSLNKVLDAFDARKAQIENLNELVSTNKISFIDGVNQFNQLIENKDWTTTKWYLMMDIQRERLIAENRYSKSLKESQLKVVASQYDEKWLYKESKDNTEYNKFASFISTFGYLDLIQKYAYELLSIPYLYQKINNKTYDQGLKELVKGDDQQMMIRNYGKDPIVMLFRLQKEISLIDSHLDWYSISPDTQNAKWYNWILSTKEMFDKAYDASKIQLDAQMDTNNISDWDGVVSRRMDESKLPSLLPIAIKEQGQVVIDNYINQQAIEISDNYTQAQALEMIKKVFNRICYAVEFNAYKSNFFLKPINFETNFNKAIVPFNLSLFNSDIKIKSDLEILNARLDYHKIYGSIFVGQSVANGSSLTEKEVLDDIAFMKQDYQDKAKDSNNQRSNLFNDMIRKIDLFKEIYYELSIFPHLFQKLVDWNYTEWVGTGEYKKDPQYGFLYKKYMVEQYLTFRDWKLFVDKYVKNTQYESFKQFESTTLNSDWYKWINTANFNEHYIKFTGTKV